MGLVMVFCPLMMTGAVELVLQIAGGVRLVVNSKVKPVAFVVQVKITLVPAGIIFSCGADSNARLNTVPYSTLVAGLPPLYAVPYRVLPDKSNAALGWAPSLLV